MGGYNSSRWHDHTRKLTVEECSKLKVKDFPKSMLVERCEKGKAVYYDESAPAIASRLIVRAALDKLLPERVEKRDRGEKSEWLHGQAFHVTRTACNYGGWRYWLICPLCKRRCGILYRRPEYKYYACRKCYDLSYISTQDARKPVGYGALAMYLTRSKSIEDKLFKVKRWRKRAFRLDAKMERLHTRLGWAWRGFGSLE
jgi:hypothetical protein